MEVHSRRIAQVFSDGGYIHFRLPYFQREYAWEKENWKTLLDDIFVLYDEYSEDIRPEHFMGSLVVIGEFPANGTVQVYKLVDGQQRLITISLLLIIFSELSQPSELSNRIRRYFTNPDEEGDLTYKLLPTEKYGDRQAYISIINKNLDASGSIESRIIPAYQFLKDEVTKRVQDQKLDIGQLFLVIINCLQVVFISLDPKEKPYQIFESLNAKGKPLSQADLVRNYVAMKLPEHRQTEIFENHWSKVEDLLQEKRRVGKSGLGELTAFLRHYLTFLNRVLCNEKHVYARFRDRIESDYQTTESFENEIINIKEFASCYNKFLRPGHESDQNIRAALERLSKLEISTGYPFLLAVFNAMAKNIISKDELLGCLKVLENYLVRRFLSGEPTNYLNKMFPSLWEELNPSCLIDSVKSVLIQKNYPSDYSLSQNVFNRKLYDSKSSTRSKTTLILETINKHLSLREGAGGYTVLDGDSTIEHILPQNPEKTWKEELGDDLDFIYEQYLHTIGNLTLVTSEWNNKLSNSSFSVKKAKLCEHALELNRGYFKPEINKWDENTIKNRTEFLLKNILEIWPSFGETPSPIKSRIGTPCKLIISGTEFSVSSWRDVAEATTEFVIRKTDKFSEIAESMPTYLSLNPFRFKYRKLSNGYNLFVNLSGKSIIRYCQELITKVGMPVSEWHFETRNNN